MSPDERQRQQARLEAFRRCYAARIRLLATSATDRQITVLFEDLLGRNNMGPFAWRRRIGGQR
jgi:hypothetical protein